MAFNLSPDQQARRARDADAPAEHWRGSTLRLEATCGNPECSLPRSYALGDLVGRYPVPTLGDLALRLRCQRCRSRPLRVRLIGFLLYGRD